MIKPVRTVLLGLVLVCTVSSATVADCSWLLWSERREYFPSRGTTEWSAPIAFVDRAACAAWIDSNVKDWEKSQGPGQSMERIAGALGAAFRTEARGGVLILTVSCLPDSVDPRAPGGRSR